MEPLKQYVAAKGLTHKQLASELGISLAMTSMILSGDRQPGVHLAKRIEAVTGIPRHLIRPDVYDAAQ